MAIEQIILSAGITIFSLGLLVVSIMSYRRFQNKKLLFVSFVFLVFFIKGVLMTLQVFSLGLSGVDVLLTGSYNGVLDLIILVFLFMATLKR